MGIKSNATAAIAAVKVTPSTLGEAGATLFSGNPGTGFRVQGEPKFAADPKHVFKEHRGELATPEEIETLRAAQRAIDQLRERIMDYADEAVTKQWKAARAAFAADPSDENFKAVEDVAGLRHGEGDRGKRRELRLTLKASARAEADKHHGLIASIRRRAADIALAKRDAIARSEESNALTFGLPYEPGETVRALDKLAYNYSQENSFLPGTAPRELLRGLVEL